MGATSRVPPSGSQSSTVGRAFSERILKHNCSRNGCIKWWVFYCFTQSTLFAFNYVLICWLVLGFLSSFAVSKCQFLSSKISQESTERRKKGAYKVLRLVAGVQVVPGLDQLAPAAEHSGALGIWRCYGLSPNARWSVGDHQLSPFSPQSSAAALAGHATPGKASADGGGRTGCGQERP